VNAVRTAPVTTPPPAAPSGRPTRGPSAVWYGVAAGIAIIGLAAAVALGAAGFRDYRQRIDGFARVTAPGQMAIQVRAAGDQVVYYEGEDSPSLAQLGITVTDPSGATVRVRDYLGDQRYDAPDGSPGRALGIFRAATAGTYQVRVTGTAAQGGKVVAGESFVGEAVADILWVALVALVTVGGSLTLAIVVLVRRSRAV
jgi:hypothetical protein